MPNADKSGQGCKTIYFFSGVLYGWDGPLLKCYTAVAAT